MKRVAIILLTVAALGGSAAMLANPDAIQHIEASAGVARVDGGVGRITFTAANTGNAVFHVYSITGQLLRVVKLDANATTTVEMAKGFYLVRYNSQWSRKVVVK